MIRTGLKTIAPAVVVMLFFGCAPVGPPDGSHERYLRIMSRYPQAGEPLRLPKLTVEAASAFPQSSNAPDVFIIVHPGYSFFFSAGKKARYRGDTFRMLELQFENEARFIISQAEKRSVVILIVPGDYETDSAAPSSYTSYLNAVSSAGSSAFYLPSITSSNGNISRDAMLDLYRFLQAVHARKVLVGGGYIGRCQKEFYSQFTTYYDKARTYLIREISTISPDDVSEEEASMIVSGLRQLDFSRVDAFLAEKLSDDVNSVSLRP